MAVEILCNNAGFGSAGPFVSLDRARELSMLRLNCDAVLDLCSRYAPAMVSRGRGAILNVASTAAYQPLPRQAAYAASKAMVLSFTEDAPPGARGVGRGGHGAVPGPGANGVHRRRRHGRHRGRNARLPSGPRPTGSRRRPSAASRRTSAW